MNYRVPDFHEMGHIYSIPSTSGSSSRSKKQATGEEIMELLWQNGQVVIQSQNQRPSKKSTFSNGGVNDGAGGDAAGEPVIPEEREIRVGGGEEQHNLFMQEDEMASWLQYPLDDSSFDRDLYADLLYTAPPPPAPIATVTPPRVTAEIRSPPPRPPEAPAVTKLGNSPARLQNFVHFSRIPARQRTEPIEKPIQSVTTGRESTVVESNETPMVRPGPRVSHTAAESMPPVNFEATAATAGTCELTVTSSPGGSRASFSASGEASQPPQKTPAPAVPEDRKRKGRENDDNDECQSEDIEFEATEAKKQARGSASTKRSRAAEVHNLSERRRRDRINEKMKALQELIPRCNKSDKASMLDEAIEYLKSLQLQVQMMSMGCPMVPMMYPGMQQYIPAMGMGMAMNRPMVPYPSMLQSPPIPNPAHMAPRFPMPAPFQMPPQVPVPDPSRIQGGSSQTDPLANFSQFQNQPRMPNLVDPYQQFLGMQQGQIPIPQNQTIVQPGDNKPSTNKETGNPDNQQFG